MRIPLLGRRRPPAAQLEPITFLPVRRVFKAQVAVRMLNDVSGWVGRKEERRKFHLAAGREYAIDEERAREFVGKGFAVFVHEPRRPLSANEIAELDAQVTRIELGGQGG